MKTKSHKKKVAEENLVQLGLDIKEPLKNKFYKIKGKIDFIILKFEVRKFLKDPFVWATVIISTVMILTQLFLIRDNYSNLPSYLPIFKTFTILTSKLVEKSYILLYPIVSTFVLLVGTIAVSNYYNREKSLVKILLFTILFNAIGQSIILIDLINSF